MKMNIKAYLCLLSALTIVACSQLEKKESANTSKDSSEAVKENSGIVKLNVTKKILDNGLTILVSENHKLPIVSYYTYYKVGGKFEKDGITGATHFLEHMMFKGAKKYGAGKFDELVEGNGGQNNAFTTNDHTVYYQSLPSEHLNKIIDLEADRMQNLLLEKNSFEKERAVVLEERKMRYENSDKGKLFLTLMKNVFEGTPYGTSVIGKIKDLKSVTRDQIWEYFKTFYAPNNAVIVIVGDVNTEKVLKELNAKFGSIPASKKLKATKESVLKEQGFEFKGKYNRSISLKGLSPNPNFMIGFKGTSISHKDSLTLDILGSILGGGESSYLHQKFITNKRPSLSNVFASNFTLQDSGVFIVGGELLRKKSIRSTKNALFKAMRKSCKEAITPRSVEKVKNQFQVDLMMGLDTNSGVARYLGDREFYFNDYKYYEKEMDLYNAITVEQLRSACNKYVKRKNAIYISIWNKH